MARQTKSSRATLAQQVYWSVKSRILRGELTFGEPVSRRRLSRELEISLPPVAEALQKLEHEGLVESRPRVGTRVRLPTEDEVRGHCMVREALECQAARLFAQKATPAQRRKLEQMGRKLDSMIRSRPRINRIQYLQLHERFHNYIPESVAYAAFAEVIQKAQLAVWTWMSSSLYWSGIKTHGVPAQRIAWHLELAQQLNSGDALKAEAEMRSHVSGGADLIVRHLQHLVEKSQSNGFRLSSSGASGMPARS